MIDDYSNMPDWSDQELDAAIEAAVGSPERIHALIGAVARLHVVRDAPQIAALRNRLAAAARQDRDAAAGGSQANDQRARVRLALLDQAAAHLSPAAVELVDCLERRPSDLTPAVVHALSLLADESRPIHDLASLLDYDEKALERAIVRLLRIGMVLQQAPAAKTPHRESREPGFVYELTPIGRAALAVMAEAVLDVELGRFPWPTTVISPDKWAEQENGQFFMFKRDGHDGQVAANCVNRKAGDIGLLSAPHLKGVARLGGGRPQPFSTVALLPSDLTPAPRDKVRERVRSIVDDHMKVRDRVSDLRDQWKLEMFAEDQVRRDLEPLVRETCDASDIHFAFAA